MSSLKMTFSLTSLIFLIALGLVFAPMSVMAQAPTVTLTEDTSTEQTRGAFKVKITFSAVVTGFDPTNTATDVTVAGAASSTAGFTPYTGHTFTAGTGDDAGKVWTATINIGTNNTTHSHSVVRVGIPGGVATADGVGNVAATKDFTSLPTVLPGTLTLSLDEATLSLTGDNAEVKDGKLQPSATFSVNFKTDLATVPTDALLRSQILVNGTQLTPGTAVNGIDVTGTDPTFDTATKIAAVSFQVGDTAIAPVRIGLNPNYAKAAAEITVPQLPTATLDLWGDIDTTDKEFAVRLTFSEAVGSNFDKSHIEFYRAKADGTISTTSALVTVDTLVGAERNWAAQCSYKFEDLPLFVTVSDSVVASVTPKGGLKIGESMPPAVDAPDKPTATEPKRTSRDIVITWKALTDATLIGYQLKVYRGDKTEQTLVPGTDGIIGTAANPLTGTTYTYRAVQADRGKHFAFTIAGVTANGVGPHSKKSNAVQVPPLFTFGGEEGPDIQICEGDTKTTGKKRADGTGYEDGWKLPLAYGGEKSENITYKLAKDAKGTMSDDLPIGFDWDTRDHQLRTIKRTEAAPETSEKAKTYYWVATLGEETKSTPFTIHVKPHQLPETPDGLTVSKVDADETNSLTMNKVELTWTQPELKDTYADCIPYPQNYVVYVEKLNDLTGEFVKPSILDPTTPVVKDEYTSVPTIAPGGGDPIPSVDEAHFTRGTVTAMSSDGKDTKEIEKVATQFTAQFPRGIYKFKIAAHNISEKSHNKDEPEKDQGLSLQSEDYATWVQDISDPMSENMLPGDSEHIVVADPPAAPEDLRAAIHTGNKVTVNWLKVTDDGGAPVEDDHSDSDTKDARDKYYGEGAPASTDFGGYVVYQVNQANDVETRYPADDPDTEKLETLTIKNYDHPTFQTPNALPEGEYVFRVTAVNIAGESLRSLSTPHAHVRVVAPTTDPDNSAPDFGNATIASITATKGQSIAGRFLPEAKDADGDDLTYSVSPELPAGLEFNNNTRALTGAPTATMTETAYTYTASDGTDSDTIGFFITVNATTGVPTATMIASKGYLVVVPSDHNVDTLPSGLLRHIVADMPNLAAFFKAAGTIDVAVTGKAKHNVIITEIMVAEDLGRRGNTGTDRPEASQWIELYNNTDDAISVSDISITFTSGYPAPAAPTDATDRLSNAVPPGWGFEATFAKALSGQTVVNASGVRTVTGNFTSLRRKYKDDKTLQKLTAADQILDGSASGTWTLTADTRVFLAGRVGTPGSQNRPTVFAPAAYVAPDMSITFNEIANRSDDSNEWIELKGAADANLKLHKISIVTGYDKATNTGTETDIFKFPDADVKIPAGGLLLLTDQNPTNNELAPDLERGVPKPVRYRVETLAALPNDGNFLLVLRNKDGKILDIAGHLAGLDDDDPYTRMWPLAGNAGAAKVGHISAKNKLAGGNVYKRARAIQGHLSNKDNGDEPAFEGAGFSGVGYDRLVSAANKEHHGTPGYANNAQISEGAAATGTVIISEVMYGDGTIRLPQWIEIHNTSDTNGIDLHNWKLYIVNHNENADGEPFEGKLIDNFFLRGVKIPPNQTAIVVSNAGRHTTNLPSHRILNLRRLRNNPLLSSKGFTLMLEAKANEGDAANRQPGDMVGNLADLDPNNRRADQQAFETPAWTLPDGMVDDTRVSIARRRTETDMTLDGMEKWGWVRSDSDTRNYDALTYYGRPTDLGTPGHTAGGVLPVSLSKFRPERLKDTGEVVVRWITESELNNAGFNILRSDKRDSEFTKVHFVAGQGTTSERTTYEWKDTTAKPNVVYYYRIQDVSLDGEVTILQTTHLRGNVTAAGKATTTWGEIKALQ